MKHQFLRAQAIIVVLAFLLSATVLSAQGADGVITIGSDWKGSVFGDIGGQDKLSPANFEITEKEEGTVTLRSSNDRGKIASTSEGIAFYFRDVPRDADFELTAKVTVASFTKNNQVSFGIMVRDTIRMNESVKDTLGSYLAVGPIGAAAAVAQYTFNRTPAGLVKQGDLVKSQPPAPGATYSLGLKKSGNTWVLTFGDDEPVILSDFSGFSGDTLYAGLFTSRNTTVSFSDVSFSVEARKVTSLVVDPGAMKTGYLQGELLDLSGLSVTAGYATGETETVSPDDCIVTGFDSASPGTKVLSVLYGGIAVEVPVRVSPLVCTALEVVFPPLATEYRRTDSFDAAGLVVRAVYNDGYRSVTADPSQYRMSIAGFPAEGYVLSTPGTVMVTITSSENPQTSTAFPVTVDPAELTGIEVGRSPLKTRYFTGDRLDLTGMTVYARYSDSSRIRLPAAAFTVSALDSRLPGPKDIIVTHRNRKASFRVEVAEKKAVGLELSGRPRTTLTTGEPFDRTGLAVSRVYDNGDREVLPESAWKLDLSGLDTRKPGTGRAVVVPVDGKMPPLSFPVAVRPPKEYTWNAVRFGQSTKDTTNTVTVRPDGTVELTALEGGGKVTGDHDGISYYYTVLDAASDNFTLEADIKVTAFAKTPHDGQESFGIMARDALGKAGDAGIFASNIAAVGGYSGGTRNEIGTQLFVRSGVTSPDGAGSAGVRKVMLKEGKPDAKTTHPAAPYRLVLSKTNSGYSGRIGNGRGEMFFEPDILNVQDSKLYLGFFTARLATIEVSNIRLSVTDAAADAPRVSPPAEPLTPSLEILSPAETSATAYTLRVKAGVAGTLLVKQGYRTLVRELEMKAGAETAIPSVLPPRGSSPFSLAFLPDDRQELTSYEPLRKTFLVTTRSFVPGADIHVSPSGSPSGTGTPASPLDLDTAVAYVREGQKIVLADGVYLRTAPLIIRKYNDGSPGAPKSLVAAPGARPVIDFQRRSEGVVASGNWWYVKGIDFARSAANTRGFTIGGNHVTVEACRFYEHGDTGLQISRTDFETTIAGWPSDNLVLNCESFDNRDPSENNADGFAAKLTSGTGNVFRGCIAHNNIDDGWDLYTKAGSGAIGAVVIESCIAYANGTLTNGTTGRGDKNGFKLGGEGISVPHIIRGSLAFGNGAAGFTGNSNPGLIARNNFAFDNGGANLSLSVYANSRPAFTLSGFYSFRSSSGTSRDTVPAGLAAPGSFLWNGSSSVSPEGTVLTREAFFAALEQAGFSKDLLSRRN